MCGTCPVSSATMDGRRAAAAVEASEAAKEVFADVALTVPFREFLTTTAYTRLP
jgi:hypothetical protein